MRERDYNGDVQVLQGRFNSKALSQAIVRVRNRISGSNSTDSIKSSYRKATGRGKPIISGAVSSSPPFPSPSSVPRRAITVESLFSRERDNVTCIFINCLGGGSYAQRGLREDKGFSNGLIKEARRCRSPAIALYSVAP